MTRAPQARASTNSAMCAKKSDLAGSRTQDPLLKREMLYQLSYQVIGKTACKTNYYFITDKYIFGFIFDKKKTHQKHDGFFSKNKLKQMMILF